MKANTLNIGVATYTLRNLPTDAAITILQRLAVKTCSLKDSHLPMKATPDELKTIVEKFKTAGITPLSVGNVGMKDEASMRAAFVYAKATGVPTMSALPPSTRSRSSTSWSRSLTLSLRSTTTAPRTRTSRLPTKPTTPRKALISASGCVWTSATARAPGKTPLKPFSTAATGSMTFT